MENEALAVRTSETDKRGPPYPSPDEVCIEYRDKASGRRGLPDADATNQPQMRDPLRHSLANSPSPSPLPRRLGRTRTWNSTTDVPSIPPDARANSAIYDKWRASLGDPLATKAGLSSQILTPRGRPTRNKGTHKRELPYPPRMDEVEAERTSETDKRDPPYPSLDEAYLKDRDKDSGNQGLPNAIAMDQPQLRVSPRQSLANAPGTSMPLRRSVRIQARSTRTDPAATYPNTRADITGRLVAQGRDLTPSARPDNSQPRAAGIYRNTPQSAVPLLPPPPTASTHQQTTETALAIQWNINGLFHNLGDLEQLVHDSQPTVLGIQELHRADAERLNRILSGRYRWTLKGRQNIYQSTAIGVRLPVDYTVVNLNTELPILAVKITCPIPVTVVSVYLPCEKIANLNGQLEAVLESISGPILLIGDFNGHHVAWGSHTSNRRGIEILQTIEKADLILLNDGTPTFTSGQRRSALDLSFCSPGLLQAISWEVLSDPLRSDHHPIVIRSSAQAAQTSRRPRWKYPEADWANFQNLVDSLCNNEPNSMEEFLRGIHQAAAASIPKTSPNPGKKALHWWSPETKAAVKARRKALRASKKLPTGHPDKEEASRVYREKRNACRDIIRSAKSASWEEFLNGISPTQTASELWRRVNALSGKKTHRGIALSIDGRTTTDPDAVADALGNYFHSLSALDGYPDEFRRRNAPSPTSIEDIRIPDEDSPSNLNQPFDMRELTFALS